MLLATETRHLYPLLAILTFQGFSAKGLALEKQVSTNHSQFTWYFCSITRKCVFLHLTNIQATK